MTKKEMTTDQVIDSLFEKVKQKKAEIAKAEKPNWVTNCTFSFRGNISASESVNIQTITDVKEMVRILTFLIREESFNDEATKRLGLEETSDFKWMGYTVKEWETDLKTRLNKVLIDRKRSELKNLEERLDKLVSPEKRREMELAEIAKELEK